jgi:hypothetical protein
MIVAEDPTRVIAQTTITILTMQLEELIDEVVRRTESEWGVAVMPELVRPINSLIHDPPSGIWNLEEGCAHLANLVIDWERENL